MGQIAYTIPTAGSTLNQVADPEVATALQTLLTWANGNIDASNLSATLAAAVGANQNAQTVKGVSNIATSESRTNTAYGTLATPDQVTGIVLPTNGLLRVWYQATWQESVSVAARAAIFLGANQLKVADDANASPQVSEATITGDGGGHNKPLVSYPLGLISSSQTPTGYAGDVTTGQAVGMSGAAGTGLPGGGPCDIFAAAGTYTVSVQFKASSGSVTASNRKLWVQALSFS